MSLRVGIDLVHVADVREAIEAHGERYLQRVYSAEEVRDCTRDAAPDPSRLAARFAAKEAAMKVLRQADEPLPWRSISVTREPAGRPRLRLAGAAEALARDSRVDELDVSITHEHDYAAAAVIAGSRGEAPAG